MDGGARHSVSARDLAQALAAPALLEDRLAIEVQRPAADLAAVELSPPHAAANALDDQVPFQLRDGADDHHDGPAQRPAGVDRLA